MSDITWIFFDRDIQKRYAGQVVVARDRRIWGAGENLDAALTAAQAQPDCPDLAELEIVVIPDEEHSFYPFPPIPPAIPEATPDTSS